MSKQIVNVQEIWRKAQFDTVTEYTWGYKVKSGQSGETYRVFPLETGGFACTCKWGSHRLDEDQRSACHHAQAVVGYITRKTGKTVLPLRASDVPEIYDLGDGVLVLVR